MVIYLLFGIIIGFIIGFFVLRWHKKMGTLIILECSDGDPEKDFYHLSTYIELDKPLENYVNRKSAYILIKKKRPQK